jgi:NAD(P)H-flavin reductase
VSVELLPAPTAPHPHRIRARWRETPETVTLALDPRDEAIPSGGPGQFNMVYVLGVGEIPLSISGTPEEGTLHTVRAVGAVSAALCDAPVGTTVGVRGPYGVGWDLDALAGKDVAVVAGGIGLAPLRPVIRHLLTHRDRFERLVFLVGARSEELLLYRHQLESWRGRLDVKAEVTLDHASPDWHGHVGVITDLLRPAALDPERTAALVCGPEVMMRSVGRALVDAGIAPRDVQVSLERNMQCAVGLCGHCQLSPLLLCRDGPVVTFDRAEPLLGVREL